DGPVQSPGHVVEDEHERGLARLLRRPRLAGEDQEAGVVLRVVLYPLEQHLAPVELGREPGGDGALAGQPAPERVLDAPRGVVSGDRLDLGVLGEEPPALREARAMRGHAAARRQGGPGARAHAWADAARGLPPDAQGA